MTNNSPHFVFFMEVCCQTVCRKHAPVLPAGAAEVDGQSLKIPLQVVLYGYVNHPKNMLQESGHVGLVQQEFLHRLVPSCLGLVLINPPRIQDATAIKNISAPIAKLICRNTFLIGETVDVHGQF